VAFVVKNLTKNTYTVIYAPLGCAVFPAWCFTSISSDSAAVNNGCSSWRCGTCI